MLKQKKAGFTLIEMIIVVSLITVVLGITSSMFMTGNRVFSDSDVRSTLQIEAQTIQEKISNIGMQAVEVTSVTMNGDEVDNIIIKSYDEDENIRYFKIEGNTNKLSISKCENETGSAVMESQDISENLESFKISYTGNITETNSIDFKINLNRSKGFSKDVTYPINFKVAFRNKKVS